MKNPDLYGLSLASRLCSIVNDHALSSVDTVLADYLLDHYHELDALNIDAFAEACQVPRSSIHRFCIKLGYANFRDLKRSSHHETDCYAYFTSLSQKPDFREILSRQIVDMIADMNTIVPDALLLQLAGKIHQAPTVCLFSSYSSLSALQDFQRPMILCRKRFHVIASPLENERLKLLKDEDLILVVSAMGRFAQAYQTLIAGLPGEKILITASHQREIRTPYDQVITISSQDCHLVKTAYAKYGVSYFFDNLYSLYSRRYGHPEN